RYGFSWLWRPVVAVLLIMAIIGLVRPFLSDIRRQGGLLSMARSFQAPTFHPSQLFTLFYLSVVVGLVVAATPWHFSAKLVPMVVGSIAIIVILLSLFNEACRKPTAATSESLVEQAQHGVEQKIHMDLTSDTGHLPVREIVQRAAVFFGYLVAFM